MPVVPYAIQPNSFLEVTIEYMLNNQVNMALFHYVYTDSAVIEDGAGAASSVLDTLINADQLFGKFKACVSEDVGAMRAYAQWIHPQRYAYVTHPDDIMATGPAEAMPQNVSVAITKRGILAERSSIGTLHMGGVPTVWVVNGKVVQPIDTPYTALANQIPVDLDVLDTGDFAPVLFNRTTPADSVFIAEAFLQDTVRVMRRRTVGLGI